MTRSAKIMTVSFVAVLGLLALGDSAYAVEGPISHWRFDEGIETTAYDSVGDNDGTIYGATWTTGIVNGALSFDGSSYINTLYAGPTGSSPRTIIAWAKTPSQDNMILSYGTATYGADLRLGLATWGGCEGVTVDVWMGAVTYTANVHDDQWHLYALVVPDMPNPTVGDILVYQDGNLLTSACNSTYLTRALNTGNANPIVIGKYFDGANYFNGLLDEVAVFDRALTLEEIQEHLQHGLGPKVVAIGNINRAIAEKLEALERIDAALEKEWAAYIALEELLASGDYGDSNRDDIVAAKQRIHSAIQHQEQSKNALEKSLQNLEDSLWLLGAEVQP